MKPTHTPSPIGPLTSPLIILLALVLSACGSSGSGNNNGGLDESTGSAPLATFTEHTVENKSSAPKLLSSQSVDDFNQLITSLFQKQIELDQDSSLFSAIDSWFLAQKLSLIYASSHGQTRQEIDTFLTANQGDEEHLNFLVSVFERSNSETYKTLSTLWVQQNHSFKSSFIDWVTNELQPSIIPVDFDTDFFDVQQNILETADLVVTIPEAVNDLRLLHLSKQSLTDAKLLSESTTRISALFKSFSGKITTIDALRLKGQYRQSSRPEGTTTLTPIANTDLFFAIIQPSPSYYDYYLSELPAMLRETLLMPPSLNEVVLALTDSPHYRHMNYVELLSSGGITETFNEVLADLGNLDSGGQYIDNIDHGLMFSITPEGLSLLSSGTLTTISSVNNEYFNTDTTDYYGSIFTQFQVFFPFQCDETTPQTIVDPFIVALVDRNSGAIRYLAKFDDMAGETVSPCSNS